VGRRGLESLIASLGAMECQNRDVILEYTDIRLQKGVVSFCDQAVLRECYRTARSSSGLEDPA
jgi:hypothetical protein